MKFDKEFFIKQDFLPELIEAAFRNARQDWERVQAMDDPAIICRIDYDCIIKFGVAALCKEGYRVRSVPGHHRIILEAMVDLMELKKEYEYLDRLRKKRNLELYSGGAEFTQKEADTLLALLQEIFHNIRE